MQQLLHLPQIGPIVVDIENVQAGPPQMDVDESYRLEQSDEAWLLSARTTFGALAGVTTLAQLYQNEASARVRGPAPAPIPKLRGDYRFQIQTQSFRAEQLRQAVKEATTGLKPPEEVQWIADVDPLDML